MSSKWHQKKERLAEAAFERSLQTSADDTTVANVANEAAMGGGEQELFERKLTKEEKKARAKAAREAKRKNKKKGNHEEDGAEDENTAAKTQQALQNATAAVDAAAATSGIDQDGIDHAASDALAAAGTICTFASSRKGVDARSRDINVTNFTLQHMGAVLLDECEIVLNHGNRYGLIGRNGCGKSTLLQALGARAVPIPRGIDIFYLSEEIEPSDTLTALAAVMEVDQERLALEQQADELNHLLGELADKISNGDDTGDDNEKTLDEQQEEVMDTLNAIYERLDALDASTAEVRARTILKGLGFTHEMQSKLTKDFSGGWRGRCFCNPSVSCWMNRRYVF